MNESDGIEKLERQIARIEDVRSEEASSPAFQKWRRDTRIAVQRVFGPESSHVIDFANISYFVETYFPGYDGPSDEELFQRGLDEARQILTSMVEEIRDYGIEESGSQVRVEPIDHIRRLCDRFHQVAIRLKRRHDGRPTLAVEDEYDAQDLLHALLRIYFDDIRPEEWTPSYAAGASRMDLLLRNEHVVVELKKTRSTLGDRQIVDQLIIDIQRYQSHGDCKALVCFVYDPDELISNPRGLETDLSTDEPYPVVVLVRPLRD